MDQSVAYCPSCGTRRPAGARFCGNCGRDLEAASTSGISTPASPTSSAMSAHQLAGLAWIVSAALIGFLGLLQLGYVGSIIDNGSLQQSAIWNLLAAAITVYFGARLLMGRSGSLVSSMIWAAINVIWNGYQVAQGATHWAYVGATVGALVAGVLSFVAYQARTQDAGS
jgi:hypothetical protein